MAALQNSMLDDLAETATRDGVLDAKKLDAWKRWHKDVLNELPATKKTVSKIEAAQNSLWERQSQLARRKQGIGESALAKSLDRFSRGEVSGDKLLNDALSNHKKMGQLVNHVRRDPLALETLKRTVWERISSGDSADILNSLAANEKSLQRLFGQEHLKNLNHVSSMKMMMERVPPPAGAEYIHKPLEGFETLTGMAVPQAATRYWAFMSGRVPKYYLAFDIAKASLYKKAQRHFDTLMKEALYDPRVAKEMAENVVQAKFPEKSAKRLGARLFALGLPYIDDTEKQEQ